MATKLFKRNPAPDVFDQLIEETSTATATDEAESAETASAAIDPDVSSDNGVADTAGAPDDAAAGAAATNPEVPGRRRWSRRVALGAAGAICVAALAGLAFLGWQYKHEVEVANASRAALDTAKDYAVTLTSIDTNGIDDNFRQVLDGATGKFKDVYSQSAGQLRQVLLDNEAMSKGMVVDAAVKSATRDQVEVLLFIDQSITNKANPEPRLDRSRVDMTMERVDGRWLASNVELK